MSNNDTLTWYVGNFKVWQVKAMGPKPTADMLASVHYLGLRPGKQALANAMALREHGVTNLQIIAACGNPQLNRMRGLISDGLFKRVAAPQADGGHTVYKCVITPKGEKRIETARRREAELLAKGEVVADAPAKPAAKARKVTADLVTRASKAAAKATKAASKGNGAVKTVEAPKGAPAEKPASEPATAQGTAAKLPVVAPITEGNAVLNETPTL